MKSSRFLAPSIAFFLVIVFVSSCSVRKADIILSQAEAMLETHPEKTIDWLQSSDSALFKTPRVRADRALLHAQALAHLRIDTNDVTIIDPAIHYYGHRKPMEKQARSWYYLGRIQTTAEAYPEALVALIRARKAAFKTKDVRLQAKIAEATGDVYGKCFLYEDAGKQYQEASVLSGAATDTFLMNEIRYALARTYNNLKQYHQADSLFQYLQKEGKNKMDPTLYTNLLADYALLKLNEDQDYVMSEFLYVLALSRRPSFNSVNHWGALAYAKAKNGRANQAAILFRQLEQGGKDDNYSVQVWKARTLALQSNYKEAYERLDMSVDRQADRVRQVLRQSAMRAQSDYFEEAFRHSRRETQLIRWIIILAFIILMIAAYVVYALLRKEKEKNRVYEANLLETVRSLSDQLEESQEERMHLQEQYIKIHQNHLKEFGSLLKTTLGTNETNMGAKQATLFENARKTMVAIVNDQQGNSVFEEQINACFDNALVHLRTELPNHTEEYYRFAGFVFAGFDNETLMAITGTRSLDSIYAKKKRLRQDIVRSTAIHRGQLLRLVR